jgi:hypothetical protein
MSPGMKFMSRRKSGSPANSVKMSSASMSLVVSRRASGNRCGVRFSQHRQFEEEKFEGDSPTEEVAAPIHLHGADPV